jgi:hypothetical protein
MNYFGSPLATGAQKQKPNERFAPHPMLQGVCTRSRLTSFFLSGLADRPTFSFGRIRNAGSLQALVCDCAASSFNACSTSSAWLRRSFRVAESWKLSTLLAFNTLAGSSDQPSSATYPTMNQ